MNRFFRHPDGPDTQKLQHKVPKAIIGEPHGGLYLQTWSLWDSNSFQGPIRFAKPTKPPADEGGRHLAYRRLTPCPFFRLPYFWAWDPVNIESGSLKTKIGISLQVFSAQRLDPLGYRFLGNALSAAAHAGEDLEAVPSSGSLVLRSPFLGRQAGNPKNLWVVVLKWLPCRSPCIMVHGVLRSLR